jgi:hypothetical protein
MNRPAFAGAIRCERSALARPVNLLRRSPARGVRGEDRERPRAPHPRSGADAKRLTRRWRMRSRKFDRAASSWVLGRKRRSPAWRTGRGSCEAVSPSFAETRRMAPQATRIENTASRSYGESIGSNSRGRLRAPGSPLPGGPLADVNRLQNLKAPRRVWKYHNCPETLRESAAMR